MTETAWNRLSAETLRQRAQEDAIVILPVASTEQHGPHLATGVDDILCTEVCRRAAAIVSATRPIVVAPTLWCGLADHHVAFGGTFSLSLATYLAVLRDLCRSVVGAGFRKIVIVNGHGGNVAGISAIQVELTRELNLPIASVTYFVGDAGGILEDQSGVMHACEGETSMMMAIRPELVDRSRLGEAHGPLFDIPSSLAPTLKRSTAFKDITMTGVAGDARRATATKGEALLDLYAGRIAARLAAGEPWGSA